MYNVRFIFGEDIKDTLKNAIPLFEGVCAKDGMLWIQFSDMSTAITMKKNFWEGMETQFQESLINDDTLDEGNRLAVQQKLKLIRKGLELMNEEGIG